MELGLNTYKFPGRLYDLNFLLLALKCNVRVTVGFNHLDR